MMTDIAGAVPQIRLPALIMAGDDVPDGRRSRTLFESLGSEDKTLKLYAGLRHEIFNEPEHSQVMADMAAWLDRCIQADIGSP
jgi:alpha-beta hydrolase superfamily lysophospholipase